VKSYFLLVWSEWNLVDYYAYHEMVDSIKEGFGGIGMRKVRRDLIERLDQVLRQLNRGLEYLRQHNDQIGDNHVWDSRYYCGQLKAALLKLDSEEVSPLPIAHLPPQFVPTKH
jgi:Zn-dependent oligopeptidase